jgi:hypothetical protein
MSTLSKKSFQPNWSLCLVCLTFGFSGVGHAQNFSVVNSGFSAYVINGMSNPTLTLTRGVTYVFNIEASGHPFFIKTSFTTGTGNAYTNGVTGNGTTVGTLTFAVPTNAPNQLFYHCSIHAAMGGTVNITNGPAPPTVRVVFISVSNNIVVKSTGTNGWTAIPEYKCSTADPVWHQVASFTNTFLTGTNTTLFNRLDPICGKSNVLLRIRNQRG